MDYNIGMNKKGSYFNRKAPCAKTALKSVQKFQVESIHKIVKKMDGPDKEN